MNCKNRIVWTHIGGGPILNFIKEKSKDLPQNIKVKFLGDLSNKELIYIYKEELFWFF